MKKVYPIIEFPSYLFEVKRSQPIVKIEPFDESNTYFEISKSYPMTEIPTELEEIRKMTFPTEPSEPKKMVEIGWVIFAYLIVVNLGYLFLLLIIGSFFMSFENRHYFWEGLLVIVNLSCPVFIIYEILNYKKLHKIYLAEYDLFLNRKKEYFEKKKYYETHPIIQRNSENLRRQVSDLAWFRDNYKNKVDYLNSEDNKNKLRRTLFYEKIKSETIFPDANFYKESDFTGMSENFFLDIIKGEFANKIFNNKTFRETPFKPDILICDNANNIVINIEIDEPYSIVSGEPIHFEGCDTNRDSFFLRKGWYIIRFAEEQIIREPQVCKKLIVDFYKTILNGNYTKIIEKQFDYPSNVTQWSKQDAINMHSRKFRNSYLHMLN